MQPLPQELQTLEQQLRNFVPQLPQTSPEQLLYQAGWEAALAQHAATSTSSLAMSRSNPTQRSNHYWAAACAALLLLSTALGWRVWHQPQTVLMPQMATTPAKTPSTTNPAPALANTTPVPELEEPRFAHEQPTALANYLELRQRITRGGLSMWPVSTPVHNDAADTSLKPTRDWQAELLREAL